MVISMTKVMIQSRQMRSIIVNEYKALTLTIVMNYELSKQNSV